LGALAALDLCDAVTAAARWTRRHVITAIAATVATTAAAVAAAVAVTTTGTGARHVRVLILADSRLGQVKLPRCVVIVLGNAGRCAGTVAGGRAGQVGANVIGVGTREAHLAATPFLAV